VKCRTGDKVWIGEDIGIGIADTSGDYRCLVLYSPIGAQLVISQPWLLCKVDMKAASQTRLLFLSLGEFFSVGDCRVRIAWHRTGGGKPRSFDVALMLEVPSGVEIRHEPPNQTIG